MLVASLKGPQVPQREQLSITHLPTGWRNNEESTLAQLEAPRERLVDPRIAEHRGLIVKTTGDGSLVEFALRSGEQKHCASERLTPSARS